MAAVAAKKDEALKKKNEEEKKKEEEISKWRRRCNRFWGQGPGSKKLQDTPGYRHPFWNPTGEREGSFRPAPAKEQPK